MESSLRPSYGGQFLVAVLVGALGSSLLFSASLAVPIIGFVSAFIAPAPLIIARLKGSKASAGLAALMGILITGMMFSPPVGAWYAAQCGIIGLVVPELLLKGHSRSRTILWSSSIALALMAVLVLVFTITSGKNPQFFIQKEIQDALGQTSALYEQQSRLSPQDLEMLKQGLQSIGQIMARTYPALATINLGLISAVTVLLFGRLSAQLSLGITGGKFSDYRVPELMVWPLITAGFALLAPMPAISTPALNVVTVLAVLYFMQGLAVMVTLCNRTSLASVLKTILAVLLLTQPYLTVIVTITGIFDYWGDFRTPKQPQGENL